MSLSIFAQRTLNSIPGDAETEFQKVEPPKPDPRAEVEIYTPEQLKKLLSTAVEFDVALTRGLVVGNFAGLRPYEFHAEGLGPKRSPLRFEDVAWEDKLLHVRGQKVRSKATRDIPLTDVALDWLRPFRHLKGPMWRHRKAYEDKMNSLRKRAAVNGIYDGCRHSFASYRIRKLKGDLAVLASEISRYEVENCLTEHITHDLRIAVGNPFCACEMDGMIFSVRGYDDDPRKLFQIPEFRRFVRKLNNHEIPWLFLACLETLWVQVLALCLVDNAAAITDTRKERTKMAFPGPDVAGFLEAQMEAFGAMCELQGVTLEESEARIRAVCESFGFRWSGDSECLKKGKSW